MFDHLLVILIRADDRNKEHFDVGSTHILIVLDSTAMPTFFWDKCVYSKSVSWSQVDDEDLNESNYAPSIAWTKDDLIVDDNSL